ncbi:MAG TPA: alpha/beta fold hydrolase [Bryobacteraceae bacterium]|nr:alpha/beta fold hydrolase [Bryobacteraceae bacterium]
MPPRKPQPQPARPQRVGPQQTGPQQTGPQQKAPPPTVSGRWLLTAASLAIVAAALCAWLTLCLLFWQGSWQLLYHPTSAVTRTPASVGLAFDPVAFATTDAGEPRLKGWWIPAAPGARYSRYTVLHLHGQTGNLGDAVDSLAALHEIGVNVLAFDYRGYGQSQFNHPSEARWREDADWALSYLTATRHVSAGAIILDGRELGANLALEVAAAHPELAGVALESPLASPVDAIFKEPRARLVPAHLLVSDRFEAEKAGNRLLIPSLWLIAPAGGKIAVQAKHPNGYDQITARKSIVWLAPKTNTDQQFRDAYSRWLDDLPNGLPKPVAR